jgi:hypothetical protein
VLVSGCVSACCPCFRWPSSPSSTLSRPLKAFCKLGRWKVKQFIAQHLLVPIFQSSSSFLPRALGAGAQSERHVAEWIPNGSQVRDFRAHFLRHAVFQQVRQREKTWTERLLTSPPLSSFLLLSFFGGVAHLVLLRAVSACSAAAH